MNRYRHLLFLLFSLAAFSCSNPSQRALKEIESYIHERPDSAWTSLQTIDTAVFRTRSDQALYRLLTAIALDKNDMDDGSYVHEAALAADWFQCHGSSRHRMLALYYYGDQLYDSGNNTDAAIFFTLAAEEAENLQDWFYAGMAQRSLGDIASLVYNLEDEFSYYSSSVSSFNKAGKEHHAKCAKLDLALASSSLRKVSLADSLFKEVIGYAVSSQDTILAGRTYSQYARHLIHLEPDSLKKITDCLDSAYRVWHRSPDSDDLSTLSIFYSMLGNVDQAANFLEISLSRAQNQRDSASISYARFFLDRKFCMPENSLKDMEDLLELFDRTGRSSLSEGMNKSLSSLYKAERDADRRRIRAERFLFLLSGLCLLLGSLSLLIFQRYKRLKIKAELLSLRDALYKQKEETDSLWHKLQGNTLQLPALSVGMRAFEKLCSKYSDTENPEALLREFEVQIRHLKEEATWENDVLSLIASVDPALVSYIKNKTEIGTLTSEERIVLYSVIARMPISIISLILGKNKSAIRMQISRLKKKIETISEESRSLLMPYFALRTTVYKRE
ncbi:MAG: hypothetical protein IJL56_04345 [Bacteroidales bacterium]|nr:hypothetical protein [Bacteroidales bacterium]